MKVKEVFGVTIQGEGTYAGHPAIFVRFSTCNMWSGKEADKATSFCPFCDTNFYGGTEYPPQTIYEKITEISNDIPYIVVLSGGEPLLQRTEELLDLVKLLASANYPIHIETNGTIKIHKDLKSYIDHVTCSPKLPLEKCKIDWRDVDALKLLYPHTDTLITPEAFDNLPIFYKYLQPLDNEKNMYIASKKVKELGNGWAISLQLHKFLKER